MTIKFLPKAQAEFCDAAEYYEEMRSMAMRAPPGR